MTGQTGAPASAREGVYDAEILADLADLFGPERLAGLLAGLDEEIVRRLEGASAGDPDLGANAHALISVSGTLGFAPLSRACAALEQAILAGGDLVEPLRAAQSEAGPARRAIAALRSAGI